MRSRAAPCGFILLALAALAGCRGPTQMTLVVSTDVKCTDLSGTTVTVGNVGGNETKDATSSSTFCGPSGDLGALVVVPSGEPTEEIAVKLVAGLGRNPDSCVPPAYGKGCIVARRTLRYVPHTALRISVPLLAACDGVPCGPTATCVRGRCVSATIPDPNACASAEGCNEDALAVGLVGTDAVGDAGADG